MHRLITNYNWYRRAKRTKGLLHVAQVQSTLCLAGALHILPPKGDESGIKPANNQRYWI